MAPAKKSQNQKMSLGTFLTDETLGSWADEMEDMPLASGDSRTGYGNRSTFGAAGGFGSGGFNDRGYSVREALPLPDKPPYTAHIGNLSFEVTEGDITDYFTDCSVTSVRIVEDKLERKPKGFGYVEFATVEGLKKALDFNGTQFNGRNVRVSVAEPPKDRPDAREFGDWTRKGPLPELPGGGRRTSERGFGSRNADNLSDAGSDRGERRRQPFDQPDNKVRDFGNWERRGPLSPLQSAAPPSRDGGRPGVSEGPRERKQSPAWGEGRSQDGGSRPPRREFQERPAVERPPTAPEMDSQWRTKMRPDAPAKSPTPTPQASNSPSPVAAPSGPATRPRLNLQKRTVSEAEKSPASATASATDAKASPFGAARPIDTFAKEKEIEEKRQLALRLKKEQDDKTREEKRLAMEAAKADKAAASAPPGAKEKENGAETGQDGKGTENHGAAAEAEKAADVESANGIVVEDKAVKPQETVRDIPAKASDVAWRGKSDDKKPAARSEPTADALEEDGWSTVAKPKNNRRGGGNGGSRAIAS
ncbi:MAG: hypothetical protein M1832_003462 [Thelocarpon impressellum]|nr:MAG: hypothetical protein M1832_003462 [Thelocarpon impressellum]